MMIPESWDEYADHSLTHDSVAVGLVQWQPPTIESEQEAIAKLIIQRLRQVKGE